MNELKPCPFCGNRLQDIVVVESVFRYRRVQGCCCDGPEVQHDVVNPDQETAKADSRCRAIKAWNTRTAPEKR